MSHTLTPVSSQELAGVTVPDPGDPRTAASVVTPIQALLNTIYWLYNHIPPIAGSGLHVPITGAVNDAIVNVNGWTFSGALWEQSDISIAPVLWVDIPVPRGYVLNQVHARVKGNGFGVGAHSSLPATKPTLTVYEMDPTNNNSILQTGGPVTDASASVGAYDAAHSIDITGLTWTIASDIRKYMVKLTGEAGANSLANRLTLAGISVSWSPV